MFVALLGNRFGGNALLCTSCVLYPISGLLYFLAGRRLRADWYEGTHEQCVAPTQSNLSPPVRNAQRGGSPDIGERCDA